MTTLTSRQKAHRLLLLSAIVFIAVCTVWPGDDGTQATRERDAAQCALETWGPTGSPPYDAPVSAQDRLYERCMRVKGYRQGPR